jgi:hypothetical protein
VNQIVAIFFLTFHNCVALCGLMVKFVCCFFICIFEKEAPSMARALVMAGEERELWALAGARGLNLLAAPLLGS